MFLNVRSSQIQSALITQSKECTQWKSQWFEIEQILQGKLEIDLCLCNIGGSTRPCVAGFEKAVLQLETNKHQKQPQRMMAVQRLRICLSLGKASLNGAFTLPLTALYWHLVNPGWKLQRPMTIASVLPSQPPSLSWLAVITQDFGWLFRNVKSKSLEADCRQCLILVIANYKSKSARLEIRWPHCLYSQSRVHVLVLPTCVLLEDHQEVLASHDLGLFISKLKWLDLDYTWWFPVPTGFRYCWGFNVKLNVNCWFL